MKTTWYDTQCSSFFCVGPHILGPKIIRVLGGLRVYKRIKIVPARTLWTAPISLRGAYSRVTTDSTVPLYYCTIIDVCLQAYINSTYFFIILSVTLLRQMNFGSGHLPQRHRRPQETPGLWNPWLTRR